MLGRMVAGAMTSVALLCGTLAWAGWVYLQTVGDPHRTEEVATAVLDQDEARREISGVLAGQIVERTGLPGETRPVVTTAVDAALRDDRVARNLIDAFGSQHARALGVDDPRPTTIETSALLTAVREHLGVAAPSIAALLDTVTGGTVIPDLTLPDLHTAAAGTVRSAADAATLSLAILAITLLVGAFIVGDRRHITRRYGTWALLSGIGWLAGPYVVAAIAKRLSDLHATIDVVRAELQGPVLVGAIPMVATGALALLAWLLPIWPSPAGAPAPAGAAWEPRPVTRRDRRLATRAASTTMHPAPAAAPIGGLRGAHGSTGPTGLDGPNGYGAPADTFVRSTPAHPTQPTHPPYPPYPPTTLAPVVPVAPTTRMPPVGGPLPGGAASADGDVPWGATRPDPADVDPWSIYFRPEGGVPG